MRVRLLIQAENEAQKAARWYDDQRLGLGLEFLDALSGALAALETNPQRFAKVQEVQLSREVRRVLLKRFPYKVVFEIRTDEVLVLAVAHHKRRPGYWKHRKG